MDKLDKWTPPALAELGLTVAVVGRTGSGKTHAARALVHALAKAWGGQALVFVLTAGGEAQRVWKAELGTTVADDVHALDARLTAPRYDADARKVDERFWVRTAARPRTERSGEFELPNAADHGAVSPDLIALDAWLCHHLANKQVYVDAAGDASRAARTVLVIDDVVGVAAPELQRTMTHSPHVLEVLQRGRQLGVTTVWMVQTMQDVASMIRRLGAVVLVDGAVPSGVCWTDMSSRVPADGPGLEEILADAACPIDRARRDGGRWVPVFGSGRVTRLWVPARVPPLAEVLHERQREREPAHDDVDHRRQAAAQAALRRPAEPPTVEPVRPATGRGKAASGGTMDVRREGGVVSINGKVSLVGSALAAVPRR